MHQSSRARNKERSCTPTLTISAANGLSASDEPWKISAQLPRPCQQCSRWEAASLDRQHRGFFRESDVIPCLGVCWRKRLLSLLSPELRLDLFVIFGPEEVQSTILNVFRASWALRTSLQFLCQTIFWSLLQGSRAPNRSCLCHLDNKDNFVSVVLRRSCKVTLDGSFMTVRNPTPLPEHPFR